MPAPPNTSSQSCSRFCSRPRLPFISSRTQLLRSGGPRPAPRGRARGVPNSLPALQPPPAVSAPISGRPGVLFSRSGSLRAKRGPPSLRRSRPSPGSRTWASAAVRRRLSAASPGTPARRPPPQPPPLARTGSSSFSERRTGTISNSPSSTSMGSGSPRSKPDSTSGDGRPKAGGPAGASAFTDTRRPRTAAIAASRPHHRKPAPHNPPPRAPPPPTTEESRWQPERRPLRPESCPSLWRPLGGPGTWDRLGAGFRGEGWDQTEPEVERRLRFQNTYTLRTMFLKTAERLLCA